MFASSWKEKKKLRHYLQSQLIILTKLVRSYCEWNRWHHNSPVQWSRWKAYIVEAWKPAATVSSVLFCNMCVSALDWIARSRPRGVIRIMGYIKRRDFHFHKEKNCSIQPESCYWINNDNENCMSTSYISHTHSSPPPNTRSNWNGKLTVAQAYLRARMFRASEVLYCWHVFPFLSSEALIFENMERCGWNYVILIQWRGKRVPIHHTELLVVALCRTRITSFDVSPSIAAQSQWQMSYRIFFREIAEMTSKSALAQTIRSWACMHSIQIMLSAKMSIKRCEDISCTFFTAFFFVLNF